MMSLNLLWTLAKKFTAITALVSIYCTDSLLDKHMHLP